jgi:hypothetical protein
MSKFFYVLDVKILKHSVYLSEKFSSQQKECCTERLNFSTRNNKRGTVKSATSGTCGTEGLPDIATFLI